MTRTTEVEAKFDVLDRAAARRLLRGETLAGLVPTGAPRRLRLEDRYLDTADGRLGALGWAARIRTADGGDPRLQLKRLRPADERGVRARTEIDGPAGAGLDYQVFPVSAARRRLLQLLRDAPLQDLVTLRQDRLVRDFADERGAVEVSLDRTEVIVDGSPAGRLSVLEIERQGESMRAFEDLRAELGTVDYLAPAASSKLGWARAIAARLAGSREWQALADEDAPDPRVAPVAEVGRQIVRQQLARAQAREAEARSAPEAEAIRRFRVAVRRLRATFRAFDRAYAGRDVGRVRRALSRLADDLSRVRDLDVALARIRRVTERRPGLEAGLAPFVAACVEARSAALARLIDALASPRHGDLIATLQQFAETPGRWAAPVRPPAPRTARDQVGSWVWEAWQPLLGWGPLLAVEEVPAPVLHELRLRTKRLRDLIQVVGPVAAVSADADAAVAPLVRLQDRLGDLNDALVTADRARAFREAHASELDPVALEALGVFVAAEEASMARARQEAIRAWLAATSPAARRRMGRFVGAF